MSKNKNNTKKDRRSLLVKLTLELLVVFLGVTGGFLLNNWRSDFQERQLEKKYITGFLQDIQFNIEELKTQIEKDSLWLERATPLVSSMTDGSFSEDSALEVINLMGTSSRINLQKSTYEDMTGSGNLGVISDFEKRKSIVDYHTGIDGLRFVEEHFDGYFNDFVLPFIIQKVNCLEGAILSDYGTSDEFYNIFSVYFSMFKQRDKAYRDFLEMSIELKERLNAGDELVDK